MIVIKIFGPLFFLIYKPLYAQFDLKRNVATRKNTLSGYSSWISFTVRMGKFWVWILGNAKIIERVRKHFLSESSNPACMLKMVKWTFSIIRLIRLLFFLSITVIINLQTNHEYWRLCISSKNVVSYK